MSRIIFHKKLSFTFLAFLSLLIVVSISLGTINGSALSAFGLNQAEAANNSKSGAEINKRSEAAKFNFLQNNLTRYLNGNGPGHSTETDNIASSLGNAALSPESVFTINSTGDSNDSSPSDGVCLDSAGKCTLRAALQQANAAPGLDEISFVGLPTPATIQLSLPNGISITDAVNITGPGARILTISGGASTTTGIFKISYAAAMTTSITGLTIADSEGHGISNDARLNLLDIAVKNNHTGIYNTGRVNLIRLAIFNNSGGGVYIGSSAIVNISNTTITNNTSTEHGGGIHSLSPDVTLNNVTISHNKATTSGGGIYYSGQNSGIYVRNSIIAQNTAPATSGPDVFSFNNLNGAAFTSRGNNLIGKSAVNTGFTDNVNGDKVGTIATPIDPLLGPLQNNGGHTDTRALLLGSPAKDAGNICVINSGCTTNPPVSPLSTDQRGNDFVRFHETGVDIGAFESFFPVPTINSLTPNNWGSGSGAFDLIINGNNFVTGSTVKFNGQNKTTTFVSNTQLRAQILAADVATAGQYPVTVLNPQPTTGASEPANFTVTNCTYLLNPTSQTFSASGGQGSIAVNTPNGCTWVATSTVSWITVSSTGAGPGPKTFTFSVAQNAGQERTGTIIVNGVTFTVTQNSGCTYSLSSTSQNVQAAGLTNGTFNVTAQTGCAWAAASNVSWITVNSGTGTGSGAVTFSVAPNTGPLRSGIITVGGQSFTVNQESGCSFSLNPTNKSFGVDGGSGNFNVTTETGCKWTAVSSVSWIIVDSGSASGDGTGMVAYTVAANTGQSRTGTITVGTQTFNVTQDASCSYTLSSSAATSPAAGNSGSVSVTTTAGCAWTAVSNVSWITVTSGSSGTGNGTVQYTVAANTGLAREGKITIAGKTFTVTQSSGCSYVLSPTSNNSVAAAGGAFNFSVATASGCEWTASSNVSWLTITTGASGTGTGTISYSVAANPGPMRSGIITIGGQMFTVMQENGCTININPTNQDFQSAGGTGSIAVTASDSGCGWTAVSNASWITVTNSASGSGNATVNFTVAANTGLERTGTITIGGKTFNIKQASGCTITLSANTTTLPNSGGTNSFNVSTNNAGCVWTATTPDAWITINNGTGTGNGTVTFTAAPNVSPERTGTIKIGDQTFTIKQANGCTTVLSSTGITIVPAGGTGAFNINTGAGCEWTAVSNASWLTITSSTSGTGGSEVKFTAAANIGPERTGTITVGTQTFTVTQSNGCVYTLSSSAATSPAAGNSGTVGVTTTTGCGWTAVSSVSWITVTAGASGTGNGTVQYTVAANTGPERTGTITIAGKTFTITQENGCTFNLSASSTNINENGGIRTFDVTAGVGCTWTAVSNDEWIKITEGATGSGSGTVKFSVEANTGLDRVGTITAAGKTFMVNQVTLTVRNINDSGAGSLRQAVINANTMPGDDVITFLPALSGKTILLTSGEITVMPNGALEIQGLGADILTISGNKASRIFYVNDAVLSISDLTLTQGNGVGAGGTNDYTRGGALQAKQGTVKLNRVSVAYNEITVAGGRGGGINFDGGANHTILNSTFSSNKAGYGAAIFSQGAGITVTNTTFSLNEAAKSGGAILNTGNLTLRNATITRNSSDRNANSGGGIISEGGKLNIGNSIIAGNAGPEITYSVGEFLSVGYNLIGDETGDSINTEKPLQYKSTDILDTPPLLSPLNSNGGRTLTEALLIGSPAINAGSNELASELEFDQRGSPRIMQNKVDIGAFENYLTFDPTSQFLPSGAVGEPNWYSNTIKASRLESGHDPYEEFKFFVVEGAVPPGLQLNQEGHLYGYPTANGTYSFIIKAIATNGIAALIKYSVTIGCSYSIDKTNQSILATGENGTVNLTTEAGCSWTATTDSSWITITNNPSNPRLGSGAVNYTVQPNTGSARTGKITLGGKTFTVNQASGCTFGLSATAANAPTAGFSGSVNVTTGTGCTWTAVSNASWITVNSSGGTGNATLNFTVQANTGTARTGTITVGSQVFTITQAAVLNNSARAAFDFDGDKKTDISIFRPAASGAEWWYLKSSTGGNGAFQFGSSTDKMTPADFTGDGKSDFAFFRPSSGEWIVLRSEDFSFYSFGFGTTGDIPVPADFDGDGRADPAVFRPSNNTWYVLRSTGGVGIETFGASGDVPVPADFDGDAKADFAIYRPSQGEWWINRSSAGSIAFQFGNSTDKAVSADYTGDGKADVAFWRPSSGEWFVLRSEDFSFYSFGFGTTGDIPIPADFDGDGKADPAVFRPSNNTWYVLRSTGGVGIETFGAAGDVPVPADFDGDAKADFAIYRPSQGEWWINRSSAGAIAFQFGSSADKAVSADYTG
ncbi:MAG: hypothetical protein JWN60_432, partial [Acidobacteria bacterium]|nr:hypothetical protein [Acidobacteriota bacterium]